jgi:hypothetical protein
VEQYLVTYPIQINDFDDETTIGEAKATARKTIAEYVDRLRNLATKPSHDGQTWYFMLTTTQKIGSLSRIFL